MKFNVDLLKDGKIFNITFIKKNGDVRSMNARLGVTKHLRGGQLNYDPASRGYLIVYSMDDSGYRTVNLANIIRIKTNGYEYRKV